MFDIKIITKYKDQKISFTLSKFNDIPYFKKLNLDADQTFEFDDINYKTIMLIIYYLKTGELNKEYINTDTNKNLLFFEYDSLINKIYDLNPKFLIDNKIFDKNKIINYIFDKYKNKYLFKTKNQMIEFFKTFDIDQLDLTEENVNNYSFIDYIYHTDDFELINSLINICDINKIPKYTKNSLLILLSDDIDKENKEITLKKIKLLLDNNINPNATNNNNNTALIKFSSLNNIKMVQLILNYKPDVNLQNINKTTALMNSCRHNNIEMVKLLLNHNADINIKNCNNYNSFEIACLNNYNDIIKEMLKHNVDITNSNSLEIVTKNNNNNIIKLLLNTYKDFSTSEIKKALITLSKNDNIECIKLLLEYNNNYNTVEDLEALLYLCKNDNFEAVETLIKYNNKLNLNIIIDDTTIFIEACKYSNLEIIELLLNSFTFNINTKNLKNSYPLKLACETKNESLIKLLLKHNADLNEECKDILQKNNIIIE
tara:strand:- start:23 stop:1480 length:1458 start_codon:yes stop_codon:yes gene_type:complete